jgi:hypothetical protein
MTLKKTVKFMLQAAVSVIRGPQTAVDYSPLRPYGYDPHYAPECCLPTNVDGLTERCGYFLFFENKHGERFGAGQKRLLEAQAKQPKTVVLFYDCDWSPADKNNARLFCPHKVTAKFSTDGVTVTTAERATTTEDTRARYLAWVQFPSGDAGHFTCSASEFETRYLPNFPEHIQPRALAAVTACEKESACQN